MTRLAERRLTQRHAGELLGLTERQVRRLYRAFKRHGAQGLASVKRGKPSPRRLPLETRRRALDIIFESATETSARVSPSKSSSPIPLVLLVVVVNKYRRASTATNQIVSLAFCRNDLRFPPDPGRVTTGLYVSGAQVLFGSVSASADDLTDGLVVEDNVIDGPRTGLFLVGGYSERCGANCRTTNSVVRNVTLSLLDNIVVANAFDANVIAGLVLNAGQVNSCAMAGLTFQGNTKLDGTPIAVAAANESGPPGSVQGNLITGLVVQ